MSDGFALDPRLAADTHTVGELPLSRALLMDDARYPWLVLVPRIAGACELVDLDAAAQSQLLAEISVACRALQSLYAPHKLNVAALGNVVEQLHVHIVARNTGDAAWPAPVWGRGEPHHYAREESDERIAALRRALEL
jgi:diadenosine tetraphosphate (Ap4A) HIT family hydrolase